MEEAEKEEKKKVVVSGAATGEEDAFPKVLFYPSVQIRGLSGLRLSEFVQISEFFSIYITDICQTSESFAKSVNLK